MSDNYLKSGRTAYFNQEYSKALDDIFEAAKENNPLAYYYLGTMLRDGLGTDKDVNRAIACFKKSYRLSHRAYCAHALARIYADEKKDMESYHEWISRMVALGSGFPHEKEFMYLMYTDTKDNDLYYDGMILDKTFELIRANDENMQEIKEIADMGHYRAAEYMLDSDEPLSKEKKFEYTLNVAMNNPSSMDAYRDIGYLYMNGEGTYQDSYEAAEWLYKALRFGDQQLCEDCCMCYLRAQNREKANEVVHIAYDLLGINIAERLTKRYNKS